MPMALNGSVYFIHTTHTIIGYVNDLCARHLQGVKVMHLLDESLLGDIKAGDTVSAQSKLQHLVEGSLHSGAGQIMVTCTSTGRLIDGLPSRYRARIQRIETPALQKVEDTGEKTSIVYTNPTVWPEIEQLLQQRNMAAFCRPSFVPYAFEKVLQGDIVGHDKAIAEHLTRNALGSDIFLLAQVSICSALERLGDIKTNAEVISLAELGIISLQEMKR